ncbi:hypothetical protein ECANGB1_2404 [Enterospora canceri]|uniref:Uncharacterized protein n=1 Tax=Enterospora canceri TaxID=1081671 RepID=A0A1Y1S3N5_9MICR|nr:hypothetical protein ECANGB1_2404 [Enterospora canceri]
MDEIVTKLGMNEIINELVDGIYENRNVTGVEASFIGRRVGLGYRNKYEGEEEVKEGMKRVVKIMKGVSNKSRKSSERGDYESSEIVVRIKR